MSENPTVNKKIQRPKFDIDWLVKKKKLPKILKNYWLIKCDEIQNSLKLFPYFESWSDKDIHTCLRQSFIFHYEPYENIKAKTDDDLDLTHFILEGSFISSRKLLVEKVRNKVGTKLFHYKLLKSSANVDRLLELKCNFEIIPMQTMKYYPGSIFGLGEKFSGDLIIPQQKAKCLVIPRHMLMLHKDGNNIWPQLMAHYDDIYPSDKKIFRDFLNGRKWRADCLNNVRPLRKIKTVNDIPLSSFRNELRLNGMEISDLMSFLDC